MIVRLILKKIHNPHFDPFKTYEKMNLLHLKNTLVNILKINSFNIPNIEPVPSSYLLRNRMDPYECVLIILVSINLPSRIDIIYFES